MGKIKRGLNTNERLENALKIFKDITACLEDVLKEPEGAEGLPMTQVCAKHNIDYLNLRKILSLSSFQNIYTDKVITADEIELPEMDPWEKLFRAVFGINKSEPIELPVDIEESIQYVMNQGLTDREQKILNARFGLIEEFDGDPTPMTLEDVGEKMSVTRNRIRQIEAKAIRKLRHPSRAKILRDGLTKFKETEAVKLAVIEMKTAEAKKRVEEFKKQLEERRQNVDGMSELVEVLKEDKLDALNLPVRAYNALIRTRKIKTVYDVVTTPDSELVRIRNLGRRSYRIIKTSLNEYLNEFGVTLSDVRTSLGFSEADGFLTYEETGKSIGVSGERVRQIEAKAIRQLRYPEKSKLLRDGMIKTKEQASTMSEMYSDLSKSTSELCKDIYSGTDEMVKNAETTKNMSGASMKSFSDVWEEENDRYMKTVRDALDQNMKRMSDELSAFADDIRAKSKQDTIDKLRDLGYSDSEIDEMLPNYR